METDHFDHIAASLAQARDRRTALRALGLALLGAALLRTQTTAAKGKGRKKHHRRKPQDTTTPPPTVPPPMVPPPPPATCSDGVKNGSESDVDCGGPTCARCALGQGCVGVADCSTSRCVNNVCRVCIAPSDCPTGCTCNANTGACVSLTPIQAALCVDCPRYSFCSPTNSTTVNCYPPCA